VLLALALAHATLDEETGIRQWLHLRGELVDARARIDALQREIEALRREARLLETEDFATEQAIREELGLARPGETLLRLRRTDVSSDWIP
jgi:cell division protein FtsB